MKNKLLVTLGLFLSLSASAAEPEFAIFGRMVSHMQNLRECLKEGWQAAVPTEAQKNEARTLVQTTRGLLKAQKEGIRKARKDLFTAWSKSPVVPSEVEEAENRLRTDMVPVHNVIRENMVSVLNLLTPDQKLLFNDAFKSCHTRFEELEDAN
ncbi:MAG: Spy/CpxP family protein refolding chaperone [Bdellovibrionia bacterium]